MRPADQQGWCKCHHLEAGEKDLGSHPTRAESESGQIPHWLLCTLKLSCSNISPNGYKIPLSNQSPLPASNIIMQHKANQQPSELAKFSKDAGLHRINRRDQPGERQPWTPEQGKRSESASMVTFPQKTTLWISGNEDRLPEKMRRLMNIFEKWPTLWLCWGSQTHTILLKNCAKKKSTLNTPTTRRRSTLF